MLKNKKLLIIGGSSEIGHFLSKIMHLNSRLLLALLICQKNIIENIKM